MGAFLILACRARHPLNMHQFDQMPPVPLTLEGASVLHQMLRLRWPAWRALDPAARGEILKQAAGTLADLEGERSATFSLLGHKGDLMLVHFRQSFEELMDVQHKLAKLCLWDY